MSESYVPRDALGHHYIELLSHVGHEIECVAYGDDDNVAIECVTCGEVLQDYDRPTDMPREDT